MTDDKHVLSLYNRRKAILLIMLEPWGEDYWLLVGESCEVQIEGAGEDFSYSMSIEEDHVAVYIEGGFKDVCVMQKGSVLQCGHQRPDWAFK